MQLGCGDTRNIYMYKTVVKKPLVKCPLERKHGRWAFTLSWILRLGLRMRSGWNYFKIGFSGGLRYLRRSIFGSGSHSVKTFSSYYLSFIPSSNPAAVYLINFKEIPRTDLRPDIFNPLCYTSNVAWQAACVGNLWTTKKFSNIFWSTVLEMNQHQIIQA